MMALSFSATLAIAGAAALFFLMISNRKRRLRLPPSGPFALPILGHLHLLKDPVHQTLARFSERYGPILLLRFGSRPVLHISSPELVKECLSTNDVVFANRPPLLYVKQFGYDGTVLVAAPYGQHLNNMRRIGTHELFSTARINALATVRVAENRSLLRHLVRQSPCTLDVGTLLSDLTFNMTMQMITGKSYMGDGATAEAEEGRRFVQSVKELFRVSGSSSLEDFVPLLKWVTGLEKRMKRISNDLDAHFQKMVDYRRSLMQASQRNAEEVSEERKTIIDVMLQLQKAEPDYYTDKIIKGMILTIIEAGTESSAGTMEWIMALLLNNPDKMNKVRDEIDSQIGQGRLLTDQDFPNLKYLQNVIKEAQRLYPAGPFLIPHYSSDDCLVGGYDVPRGTMLLVNCYAIQRDPKVWEDPQKFKPERFDGIEGEKYKHFPFGIGRRKCPGESLATRIMALAIGSLIQCFEWKRIGEEEVDMEEGGGLSVPRANPLEATCTPRQVMLDAISRI